MNEKCKLLKKRKEKEVCWGGGTLGKPPWCEASSPLSLPTFILQEGRTAAGTLSLPFPELLGLMLLSWRISFVLRLPGDGSSLLCRAVPQDAQSRAQGTSDLLALGSDAESCGVGNHYSSPFFLVPVTGG